jgi:transposase InsO family protein
LKTQHGISERRACEVLDLNRSTYRYRHRRDVVDAAHQAVVRLSERYDYWGYRKIHDLLKPDVAIGRDRVRIIRRREGLQVPRKRPKRRLLGRSTRWVYRAEHRHHVWSYDFVHDQTIDGRTLKCLTVVDEFAREGLAIRSGRSLTAPDVIRTLEELVRRYGRPVCLRSDNGPEFIAHQVKDWLEKRGIGTHYIDPGSPWQNPFNESFNSIFRTTCLDRWAFASMAEARAVIADWLYEYNTIRPHGSLGGRSPAQFIQELEGDVQLTTLKQRSLT